MRERISSGPDDPAPTPDDEALDEEIDESFPASDPPSNWAGPERDEER